MNMSNILKTGSMKYFQMLNTILTILLLNYLLKRLILSWKLNKILLQIIMLKMQRFYLVFLYEHTFELFMNLVLQFHGAWTYHCYVGYCWRRWWNHRPSNGIISINSANLDLIRCGWFHYIDFRMSIAYITIHYSCHDQRKGNQRIFDTQIKGFGKAEGKHPSLCGIVPEGKREGDARPRAPKYGCENHCKSYPSFVFAYTKLWCKIFSMVQLLPSEEKLQQDRNWNSYRHRIKYNPKVLPRKGLYRLPKCFIFFLLSFSCIVLVKQSCHKYRDHYNC